MARRWPLDQLPRGPKRIVRFLLLISYPGMIVSVFLAAYVWADRPGAGDVGRPSLSGWLVRFFGVRWGFPAGMILFVGIALVCAALIVLIPFLLQRLSGYLSRPPGGPDGGTGRVTG